MKLTLAHLVSTYGPGEDPRERGRLDGARMRSVHEFIEDHLAECLALDTLAQIAAMSTFHFARSFKAAMGLSPHRYVVTRRMDRARRLILETGLPIAEVAF